MCMDHVPAWVDLTSTQKAVRRGKAARDLRAGMSQAEVARKYGVTPQSVWAWNQRLAKDGLAGMRSRPQTGRPTKLNEAQCRDLLEVLLAGPEHAGFDGIHLWNGRQILEVIRRDFGVDFHEKYVQRLLRNLGFRLRMPDRQALEKDLEKKRAWRQGVWEYAKKNSVKDSP